MVYSARKLLILAGILLTMLPIRCLASAFSGTLNFTGGVEVGATSITFACSVAYTPACPTGYGNFSAPSSLVQAGDFVPYGDQFGLIANLDSTDEPGNTSVLLSNFLTFEASTTLPSPDLALGLTYIALGVFGQADCTAAPAPGQTCTPDSESWFNLSNTATGSTISFSFSGLARTISTGETAPFTGTFTAQFEVPYQDLLTALETDLLPVSFAASISTDGAPIDTAPEIGSFFMAAAGMLLCGTFHHRRTAMLRRVNTITNIAQT
jgi:hypothetical protein